MKCFSTLLTLLAFISLQGWGQTNFSVADVPAAFEITPLSDIRFNTQTTLQDRTELSPQLDARLKYVLDSMRTRVNAKGISASIVFENDDVWEGTAGNSGSFFNDFVRPEMVFGVGSVSKTIVAATLLKLQEEGTLDLDDPLSMYLTTDFPNIDEAGITIRQILNHTSGINNYTNNPDFTNAVTADLAKIWNPEEVLINFVLAPDFAPGTQYSYSNSNFVMAGLIVNAATGQNFHTVCRNKIIGPLNLPSLVLYPNEAVNNPIANLWFDLNGDGAIDDFTGFGLPLTAIFSGAWTAGAYMSTAADIAKWMDALLTSDVLTPASLTEMKNVLGLGDYFDYGLGLMYIVDDVTQLAGWGHGGDIIYKSLVLYVPSLDASIAVLCNDGSQNGMEPVFKALLWELVNFVPTSTIEASIVESGRLSPNPSSTYTVLNWDNKLPNIQNVSLTSANGKTTSVQWTKNASQVRVQWSAIAAGLYYVQVQHEGGVQYMPIVIR